MLIRDRQKSPNPLRFKFEMRAKTGERRRDLFFFFFFFSHSSTNKNISRDEAGYRRRRRRVVVISTSRSVSHTLVIWTYLGLLLRSRIGHSIKGYGTQSAAGCWNQICKQTKIIKKKVNIITIKFK